MRKADGYLHLSLHPLVRDWTILRLDDGLATENTLASTAILQAFLQDKFVGEDFVMSLEPRNEILSHLTAWQENFKQYLRPRGELLVTPCVTPDFVCIEQYFTKFYHECGRFVESIRSTKKTIVSQTSMSAFLQQDPFHEKYQYISSI